MNFIETELKGSYLIDLEPKSDERGFLNRLFCQKIFKKIIKDKKICQINHTYTKVKGTIRGIHFQKPPFAETKIIFCLKGKIWDVIIDLRKGSPTFLRNFTFPLSDRIPRCLFVPEGFAHGFQTLTDDCEMLYFHTAEYNQKFESGLNAFDPIVNIKWPKQLTCISKKDNNLKILESNFKGIEIE